MGNRNLIEFRQKLANELRTIGGILLEFGVIRNNAPIESAAGRCVKDEHGATWSCSFSGLILEVGGEQMAKYRNTRPERLHQMEIELSAYASGRVPADDIGDDPFVSLSVNCAINFNARLGAGSVVHACAWHLDRIQGCPEEESKNFAHPHYHFQFGGRSLPDDVGSFLVIEPPRVAHPPMDPVLAIDFVVSNYFPGMWGRLRKDYRYRRIMTESQLRCWRPYVDALALDWNRSSSASWNSFSIWPQLMAP